MNWILNVIKKVAQTKAEDNAEEQNKQVQSDMFKDVMDIDEKELKQEADVEQAGIEEALGVDREKEFDQVGAIMAYESGELDDRGTIELFSHLIKTGLAWSLQGSYGRTAKALIDAGYLDEKGNITVEDIPATQEVEDDPRYHDASKKSAIQKIAAYNVGDTQSETVENDYHLRISGLSDYNLAEILAEAETHDRQSTTLNFNEEKEKQLKAVKSDRSAAETKAFNLVKDHSLDDWRKYFKKLSEYDHKVATEEELRGKDWKKGDWRTKDKDSKAVSDDDKVKDMEGVGGEEEKGQVGKEASKKMKCPECGGENITPAEGYKLNKCDSCHTAFDDESAKESPKKEASNVYCSNPDCEAQAHDKYEGKYYCPKHLPEKTEKKADENLEQEVELDLPAQEVKDLPEENVAPLEPTIDIELAEPKEKVDDKITQKIDEKVEEKTEEIAEKIEEKIEEHAEEMSDKIDVKVEEKIEEAFEEHHEDHHENVLPTGLSDTHEDEEKEIPAAASKKETLKKIAEVESPWKVITDENGVESIARVAPKNIKESKDDDENDKVSKDLN